MAEITLDGSWRESRSSYAAKLLRIGNAVVWSPRRNESRWCGPERKYKKRCGPVPAALDGAT